MKLKSNPMHWPDGRLALRNEQLTAKTSWSGEQAVERKMIGQKPGECLWQANRDSRRRSSNGLNVCQMPREKSWREGRKLYRVFKSLVYILRRKACLGVILLLSIIPLELHDGYNPSKNDDMVKSLATLYMPASASNTIKLAHRTLVRFHNLVRTKKKEI